MRNSNSSRESRNSSRVTLSPLPQNKKYFFRSSSVVIEDKKKKILPSKLETLQIIKEKIKKSKRGFSTMTQMKPSNMNEEKNKFYDSNKNYNPQFSYLVKEVKMWYSKPHNKYLKQALKILESALLPFGNDPKAFEASGGRLLNQEETFTAFNHYIELLGFQENISLEFCNDSVVQTYVNHIPGGKCQVFIGLPIRYRSKRINGVLNHEIGTHILRKLNDHKQIWHKKRKRYNMSDFMMIEEGLAGINQQIANVKFIY